MNQVYSNPYVVAQSDAESRAQFVRKTYLHLAGAIAVFVVVMAALVNSPIAAPLTNLMVGTQFSWLIVLGLFMGVSWLADRWATSDTSRAMQYAGLGLFILAEAIIFLPLIMLAVSLTESASLLVTAGMITGGLFLGLTAIVLTTRIDFSFLRGVLMIGGFVALGFIAASILFGFNLGTIFSVVMVAFAGAAILYQTSNVFRTYRTDQYVAASLALFSSIALMFWYVLRLLIASRN